MRVIFFGNNLVASQILPWLLEQHVEVVGLVVHPVERRTCGSELLAAAEEFHVPVMEAASLRTAEGQARIREWAPQLGVCVSFGYLLRPELLPLFSGGVINLHPSLLPYNRGADPNVWSIVEATPAGVSLHYIDDDIDTGDIIAQRPVPVDPWDTGETLYRKLEEASVTLFHEVWPIISAGQGVRAPQSAAFGTMHHKRDVHQLDHVELDRTYTGRELLAILRARTFPPHRNVFFVENGRRVYVELKTYPE